MECLNCKCSVISGEYCVPCSAFMQPKVEEVAPTIVEKIKKAVKRSKKK